MTRPQPLYRYIYVIGSETGLQKVGLATDPRNRLATRQTACPFDLLLHFTVAVPFGEAHNIKRRAHRLLARTCVRNEWFGTTPVEAIAAVKSASAVKRVAEQVHRLGIEPRSSRLCVRRCCSLIRRRSCSSGFGSLIRSRR